MSKSTLILTIVAIVIVVGLLFVSLIASILAFIFFLGTWVGIAYDRDFGPQR